jgi:hypothetical protein
VRHRPGYRRGGGGWARRCPGTRRQLTGRSPLGLGAPGGGGGGNGGGERGARLGPPLAVVPVVTGNRAGGRALRASEKGGYPHHGVRAARWGGRPPAITRAVPGARLCTWSTGSLSWRRVEEAEGRPDHQAEVVTERTATSPWPARRETVSSVRKSPTPGRSTLAPNREKKPSAALPQRPRAWDRSWRQTSERRPWPQRFTCDHRRALWTPGSSA